MMRFSWLVVAAFGFSGTALGAKSEEKIKLPSSQSDVRAAMTKFRPATNVKGQLRPTKPKQTQVEGEIVVGDGGQVLLKRTVDAATATKLERMGFVRIKSPKEIRDRTILGSDIYVLYQVDKKAFLVQQPERLAGAKVKLEVRHAQDGTPVITALRKAQK